MPAGRLHARLPTVNAHPRWCKQVEEEFVAAIRGQEKVRLTTFEQGMRYMQFTEAVTRSLQSGATVRLPL
jgi:predicted dehydrogenase